MKYLKMFESFKKTEIQEDIIKIIGFGDSNKFFKNFYHAFPKNILEDVEINGLQIEYSQAHRYEKGIYLTDNIGTAITYEWLTENDINGEVLIAEIPFKNLNVDYMKPDDYELFDLIKEVDVYENILDYFNIDVIEGNEENEKLIWDNINYLHSLWICEQMLYTSDISYDSISNIYTMEYAKKNYEKITEENKVK